MVRTFTEMCGVGIRATDGSIGTVSDLYFDDTTWRVKHCVIDTGRWFADRFVLVPPRALSVFDPGRRELWVRLARSEIRSSRRATTDKPVSRQQPILLTRQGAAPHAFDRHLRSCRAVLGHRLDAVDGTLGRVGDFAIDDHGWTIRNLILDSHHTNVSANPRVVVPPQHVDGISWPKARISIHLSRAEVMTTAPNVRADLFH
jgi:hypothetical protein